MISEKQVINTYVIVVIAISKLELTSFNLKFAIRFLLSPSNDKKKQ